MTEAKNIHPELTEFLKYHRDRLNQEFRIRWLQNKSLDGAAFLDSFTSLASGFLNRPASRTLAADQKHSALLGAYLLLLEVPGTTQAGHRSLLSRAMQSFPLIAGLDGRGFLARIYNYAHNLIRFHVDPERWWVLVEKISFLDSEYAREGAAGNRERFYRLVAALGYLAGMTHLRFSALEVLQQMDDREASALFPKVAPEDLRQWLIRLSEFPFAGLKQPEPILLGGYQGMQEMVSGARGFNRPPSLLGFSREQGALLVSDQTQNYLVFVDRFGSQVLALAGNGAANEIKLAASERSEKNSLGAGQQADCIKKLKNARLPVPGKVRDATLWNGVAYLSCEDSHYLWAVPQ